MTCGVLSVEFSVSKPLKRARRGRETETERLEAAAEARCAAICGDTHTPLSFAFADIRAATFIESPYRQ